VSREGTVGPGRTFKGVEWRRAGRGLAMIPCKSLFLGNESIWTSEGSGGSSQDIVWRTGDRFRASSPQGRRCGKGEIGSPAGVRQCH